MARISFAATATLILLAGCSGSFAEQRPELAYLPPSSPPPEIARAYVEQPRILVFGNVADRLVQEGLELQTVDQAQGRIVAVYWGDPEPFIDCGWLVIYDENGHDSMPASRGSAILERRRGGRIVDVEREMDLNARLVVEMSERDSATVVRTMADYALTKKALVEDGATPLDDETIRFRTGEAQAFDIGTTCQPKGTFERLVLDALPATAVVD